jgi:hypothetical protein
MEPSKRVASSNAWDRLPKEIVSMITAKVVETSVALLEDLHNLRLCNKATKRASLSCGVANCFNLDHHYQSTIWGDGDTRVAYLQTVDWLVGVSNGETFFIKGMGDVCTGRLGGVALLSCAVEEGDIQAAYVLAAHNYYKHGATEHVFNLIRYVYGEVTSS